jgi:ketosteroid isomerase-like protein
MKRLITIIPLVILLCFTFSCQQGEEVAEEPAVDIEAEREALGEAFTAWINAAHAKDVDAMLSFITEDVAAMYGSELRDKTWLGEFWTDHFSKGNFWTIYPPDKIVVSASGDLAYIVCGLEFTQVVEGESRINKFYSLQVWKKQADGTWKVVAF